MAELVAELGTSDCELRIADCGSPAEFVAKMGIVEEEADECGCWLEMLVEASIVPAGDVSELVEEASAILAMTVSSIRTARKRL